MFQLNICYIRYRFLKFRPITCHLYLYLFLICGILIFGPSLDADTWVHSTLILTNRNPLVLLQVGQVRFHLDALSVCRSESDLVSILSFHLTSCAILLPEQVARAASMLRDTSSDNHVDLRVL